MVHLLVAGLLSLVLASAVGGASGRDRRARDFGAVPGDGRDDTEALRAAVSACLPGDRLMLEPGVYDVTGTIPVEDTQELTIAGNGAELVMRGYDRETGRGAFELLRVERCRSLLLHDLSVDQLPARHLEGTIIRVSGDSFDLEVLPEYLPITGRERIGTMMDYHSDGTPNGRQFNTSEYDSST